MEEFTQQLLAVYEAQVSGNTELIQQTYEFIEQANQNPAIIRANLQILQTSTHPIIKSHAALSLAKHNSTFVEQFSPEEKTEFGQQIIGLIANELNYDIQRYLAIAFETLDLDEIAPVLLEFTQNAMKALQENNNAQTQAVMTAAILLLQSKNYEILEHINFVREAILLGLNLPNPHPAYVLAFNIGTAHLHMLFEQMQDQFEAPEEDGDFDPATEALKETEDCQFFKTVFENSLTRLEENINNAEVFEPLYNLIYKCVGDSEDEHVFVDPFLIINHFMPMIANDNISIQAQTQFANLINRTLNYIGITDSLMDSELAFQLFDQYLQLSALIFEENSEDSLAMSPINIFEDLCTAFGQYSDFVDHALSCQENVEQQHYPGLLLAYSYLFKGQAVDYEGNIARIVELIEFLGSADSLLARDIACLSISNLADVFGSLLDDYLEDLTNACITIFEQSAETELSPEPLISLRDLFESVSDTDPVFLFTYENLVRYLRDVDPRFHMLIFQCIVTLIYRANQCVTQHYEEIKTQLFSFLESCAQGNTFLIPSIISAISKVSMHCPERFAPELTNFMQLIIPLLDQDDNDIKVEVLHFIGSMAFRYKTNFKDVFPGLIDKLFEIGSIDTTASLPEEVQLRLQQIMNGEVDDEEEEENARYNSIVALPAIALHELTALLMNSEPEVIAMYGDRMIEYCSMQMASKNSDAQYNSSEALAKFAQVCGQTGVNAEHWTPRIIEEACKIMSRDSDPSVVSPAAELLISVVQWIGARRIGEDMAAIIGKVSDFMSGKLEACQYMDDSEELLDSFSKLFQTLICEYDSNAVASLGALIPQTMNWLTSKKPIFRSFALPVMGCFVEYDGKDLPVEVLQTVYQYAMARTMNNDPNGAWVLNEFTTGATEFLRNYAGEVFEHFKSKLALPPKRAESFKEFMQRVVSVIGELQRIFFGDEFALEPEDVKRCLQNMPSTIDESENLGLGRFYLWLLDKYSSIGVEDFARAGIRFLMMSDEEIGDQLMVADFFGRFVTSIGQVVSMLPNRDEIIAQECLNVEEKIARFNSFFAQPQ